MSLEMGSRVAVMLDLGTEALEELRSAVDTGVRQHDRELVSPQTSDEV